MLDGTCLLAPAPALWERWQPLLLHEVERLREEEDFQGGRCDMGWIHHARACTLRNIRLAQSCLVLVLEGEKALLSGGAQWGTVPAGGALFLPRGTVVSCVNTPKADKDYLAVTVGFGAPLLDSVQQRLAMARDALHPDAGTVRDTAPLLEGLHTFLRLLPAADDPMLARMQQEQMVYSLWKGGVPVFTGSPRLVSEIRALVESAPHDAWSAPKLAERLFMSERTLRRHLSGLSTSPSELVRISRLHCGLDMLMRERIRIGDVAAHCGYSSPSRFASRFQELFGVSPSDVQASHNSAPRQLRIKPRKIL